MKERRSKRSAFLGVLLPMLVLIGIGAFFAYVNGRRTLSMPEVCPKDGVVDIRDVPVEKEVYHLVNRWAFYGDKLLGPEDFADENNMPEETPYEESHPHLGTYRLKILAKPDMYLALCSFSIDYSTRIFVNGTEVRALGVVSEDPEKTQHQSRYMTIPLYTGDGEVEIIYQYANFMHNEGGFIQATTISSAEKIDEYVRGITIYSLFVGCGLLFIAFYFMVYAVYQRSFEYTSLAICCILISFRNSYFVYDYLVRPTFPFILQYRLFILTVSLIPCMIMFLPAAFFPKVIGKKAVAVFSAVVAVLAALHFVLKTQDLVALCHISYYISIACACAIIVRFVWYAIKRKRPNASELLTLAVLLALYLLMLWEGINTGSNSIVAHFGVTPFGMLMCIFGLSISTNRKIRIQAELLAEEQKKNELLGQANEMNRSFLQTVAHELRTPLSVISGYAQLTEIQIQKGKLSPQMPERLQTIRSEADRLGAMVANLMSYTYGEVSKAELHMVDPQELLHNAALIAEPVCAKKGNQLVTTCDTKDMIHGNFELLLQVLINLIVNASRHTENGEVRVEAHDDGRFTAFSVTDTGTGIDPKAVEHIFERGYTTDGGSGLGLAICLDTVRMHGGEMTLVSTGEDGTTFRFTIPKEA